jgi:ADP-ribosylglycohydrolase
MDIKNYQEKVMGCWLGKAVGGTLGQPYEGCDGPLNLTYYDPVPTDMIPNDDLDLQVLWACILDGMGQAVVDRTVFADAWLKHVDFPWDEYGIAIRNLRNGIPAPYSGSYDNWFKDGLGAAIRSEIWACLSPGNPELAAKYAYEDACVDHAGDGIYAEQFLAALESMAFVENDIDKLLDAGISVIPADSRLATAIRDTRQWCSEFSDWLAIRQKILDKWGSENFTDAVMNIPFAVMALLLGKGDFSESICLSVNCGRDADCTTATVGAILGIINPDGINEKWLKPIGRKLVINDGITGITHPATLDDFTDMIIALRKKIILRKKQTSIPIDLSKYILKVECGIFSPWFAQDENKFMPELSAGTENIILPGCCGGIDAIEIPPDSLYMMRFKFKLAESQIVRVMFNTPVNSRIWINGKYAFGREGGRMAPSFHRCPINQYKDIELDAGEHELLAGIAPVNGEKNIDWVIGIGDVKTKQWLSQDACEFINGSTSTTSLTSNKGVLNALD